MLLSRRWLVFSLVVSSYLLACGSSARDPGSPAPTWKLEDVQPQSERRGQVYGLDQFRGQAVVVGIYAGWCNVCVAQLQKMELMQKELREQGVRVQFLAINRIDAETNQSNVTEVSSFPIFQDTAAVNAWKQHETKQDDIIVYDRNGKLHTYFSFSNGSDANLWVEPGYNSLRNAIVAAQ